MKVISFKICPFVQRVTALLEAKQIPYDIEFISLSDKPQWFLDLSPNGQVPVLITDSGQALFESDAIVEYLEEAFPPLQDAVSLEQKAVNRAWSYLASKNCLVQCGAQRRPDAATGKDNHLLQLLRGTHGEEKGRSANPGRDEKTQALDLGFGSAGIDKSLIDIANQG